MTALQRCIVLSGRCVDAYDRRDYDEMFRLMKERDALYLELHPFDATTFIAWGRGELAPDQVDQLLATEEAS